MLENQYSYGYRRDIVGIYPIGRPEIVSLRRRLSGKYIRLFIHKDIYICLQCYFYVMFLTT